MNFKPNLSKKYYKNRKIERLECSKKLRFQKLYHVWDKLYNLAQLNEEKLAFKKNIIKKEKEIKEMKEVTFKPKIISYSNNSKMSEINYHDNDKENLEFRKDGKNNNEFSPILIRIKDLDVNNMYTKKEVPFCEI